MASYDRQVQLAMMFSFVPSWMLLIQTWLANWSCHSRRQRRKDIETSNDIAKIASGQAVNPPQNANAQLNCTQQYLQGTEQIPADDVQQRLQQDEKFRQRMELYQKQLTFQINNNKMLLLEDWVPSQVMSRIRRSIERINHARCRKNEISYTPKDSGRQEGSQENGQESDLRQRPQEKVKTRFQGKWEEERRVDSSEGAREDNRYRCKHEDP